MISPFFSLLASHSLRPCSVISVSPTSHTHAFPPRQHNRAAIWCNPDPCGAVCACFTYLLVLYAQYTVTLHVIAPWMGYSLPGVINTAFFNLLACLAHASHARAMLTDPGAVSSQAEVRNVRRPSGDRSRAFLGSVVRCTAESRLCLGGKAAVTLSATSRGRHGESGSRASVRPCSVQTCRESDSSRGDDKSPWSCVARARLEWGARLLRRCTSTVGFPAPNWSLARMCRSHDSTRLGDSRLAP